MIFVEGLNTLYLDLDGVLADFNAGAFKILGMEPEEFETLHGKRLFWKMIHSDTNFFLNLPPMADSGFLYDSVKHLNPIILTGIPSGMNPLDNQKLQYCLNRFGSQQKVICCLAKEKYFYCKPGDILIDDRTQYKHLWESADGTYIVHKSAQDSIKVLRDLGVLGSGGVGFHGSLQYG